MATEVVGGYHRRLPKTTEEKFCQRASEHSILGVFKGTNSKNGGKEALKRGFENQRRILEDWMENRRQFTEIMKLLNVDRLVCASSGKLVKSERFISRSSASDNHIPSGPGDQSVAKCASLKINTAPTYPMRMSQRTDYVQNDGNDLKTSARGVVQKSKSSMYSRHQPSRLGSYSGKYSSKMSSPYDLFIKLYNCDKVELRPCGLTNCGNSCYANVVLPCLAFTRPLSAYVFQGLHSKACLKKNWCFTCEFESLLLKAKQGKSPLPPIGITSHIHYIGSYLGNGKEEDAHEFFRYAIDAMEYVCLKEVGTNVVDHSTMESTLVQLTSGGYLQYKIKCMRSKGKSERQERMMDLTVEIHGDIGTLEEAIWESADVINEQFPFCHLEDKVKLLGGSIVSNRKLYM